MKIGDSNNTVSVYYSIDPSTGKPTDQNTNTQMPEFRKDPTSDMQSQFQAMKDTHKITVSFRYLASGDMAKIYAASSAGAVRSVMHGVNAQMRKAKSSGAEANQVSDAVRRMKRVLSKAGAKLGRLSREATLEKQARAAESMRREKAVKKYAEQLQRKRRVRRAQEYCEILVPGDLLHAPDSYRAAAEFAIPNTVPGISTDISTAGSVGTAPAAAPASGAAAAPAVVPLNVLT